MMNQSSIQVAFPQAGEILIYRISLYTEEY